MEGAAAAHRLAILHRDIKPGERLPSRAARSGAAWCRGSSTSASKIPLDATRESLTLTREGLDPRHAPLPVARAGAQR